MLPENAPVVATHHGVALFTLETAPNQMPIQMSDQRLNRPAHHTATRPRRSISGSESRRVSASSGTGTAIGVAIGTAFTAA